MHESIFPSTVSPKSHAEREDGALVRWIAYFYSKADKRTIPYSSGTFFITFTCHGRETSFDWKHRGSRDFYLAKISVHT